ncbi:DUF1491 family protein [Allosphingosinicella indica]|uniref:DUF1491 family protein n=1 Tax=Allosphingosinicella indica TaxID=941907 RepID=A0A1X7G497_9SPHN|nr:DUF1491 family protein [Allosphingosinicella indica]SMF63713.1 hypothetical protein SAMN06295910_1116 [Allosphingosinicella indica]
MTPRLASDVLVRALRDKAQAEGGFATVLSKGDAQAGSVLLVLAERGVRRSAMERLLDPDGNYRWRTVGEEAANPESIEKFLSSRQKFDPDLWILELDIASAERFAAEMTAFD